MERAPFATSHLHIRPLSSEDSSLLLDWINNKAFIISKSSCNLIYNFDPETIIETVLRKRFDLIIFVIEEIASGKTIRTCQLFDIDCVQKTAEMQIQINNKLYTDKGFEGEAAHILANFGFHQLQMQHIYLKVFGSDGCAVKFFKKSGFGQESQVGVEILNDGNLEDVIVMEFEINNK